MEIKILKFNNKVDLKRWEDFVFQKGYLYQSIKWQKILKESYNFNAIYLFLEEGNKILSLLPLFHVKFEPFINELVSIPHFEAGGFINPEYYSYFLNYIKKYFPVKNLKIYQFNEEIDEFPKNDINSIFFVNIPETMDGVYKYIKKGIKRSLKNILEKSDFEIIKGNDDYFIEILYKFNVLKNKEFGTPHHSFKFIESLIKNFKDDCVIYCAKKGKNIYGCSLLLFYNKISYHFYHFIPQKYLKLKLGGLLYFHLFKESFERGMEKFSFGRSPKGSGPYNFKKQMKADEYPLYIYNFRLKNNQLEPEKIKIISEKYSWAAKVWSKLPLSITNILSPKIRKWIY